MSRKHIGIFQLSADGALKRRERGGLVIVFCPFSNCVVCTFSHRCHRRLRERLAAIRNEYSLALFSQHSTAFRSLFCVLLLVSPSLPPRRVVLISPSLHGSQRLYWIFKFPRNTRLRKIQLVTWSFRIVLSFPLIKTNGNACTFPFYVGLKEEEVKQCRPVWSCPPGVNILTFWIAEMCFT